MTQNSVALVVDSSCCLPKDLLDSLHITQVPHELIIDKVSYSDGVDISATEFYKLINLSGTRPTTSAPSPAKFLKGFKEAGYLSKNILCLTLSRNFSSTYQNACLAMKLASKELPDLTINVIDTQTAGGAEGLIALAAARASDAKKTPESVISTIKQMIPKVQLIAFVDTLSYLSRSGRIPKLAAWAGSLLSIKPLMEMRLGTARLLAKPRSRNKAVTQMIATVKDRVLENPSKFFIMHANSPEYASTIKSTVESQINCSEVILGEFTPVMGTHTGPGLLGIAFHTD